jgi:hypothetical protein
MKGNQIIPELVRSYKLFSKVIKNSASVLPLNLSAKSSCESLPKEFLTGKKRGEKKRQKHVNEKIYGR